MTATIHNNYNWLFFSYCSIFNENVRGIYLLDMYIVSSIYKNTAGKICILGVTWLYQFILNF